MQLPQSEGRSQLEMAAEMLEDQLRDKPTHALRICGRGRRVEAAFLVLADRLLSVPLRSGVAARVRQRAAVEAGWIKHRPTNITELLNTIQIREGSGWFRVVPVRVLALMPGHRSEARFPVSCSDVLQLPDAGWFASWDSGQIFGVLKQAARVEAPGTGCGGCSDHLDREIDKLVAIVRTLLLRC